ncbi:MAG TPA: amidohydrolase [Bryobacteraceae bacterium]|nr:amidohydrolase [Bryobacteraceae bacterium]
MTFPRKWNLTFFLIFAATAWAQPADLVLRNGKLVTLESALPEAQALAAKNGRIAAIGSNQAMAAWIGPHTRVIDLAGRLAIPGYIEGHGHFTALGASKLELNLRDARNWDEIVAQVAAAARQAKPGTWILGSGFHQAKWDRPPSPSVEGFPVHDSLSKVSPRNPVWLTHASGHAGFANAEAMRLAGITQGTPDPSGGQILRDAQGRPTGLLKERAQELVERALASYRAQRSPAEIAEEARHEIALAERECLSKGITTFEDAGSPPATVDLFRSLAEQGKLGLRLWVMLRAPNTELAPNLTKYRMSGIGDDHLTVRAIKRFADGALGSHGAWLLAPYSDLPPDAPNRNGINVEPMSDIRVTAELAIRNGYQLCVHAIGDRANREVLNLYESVFKEHPDKKNLRWRIEHAQHLDPADIPRFGQLGVIASMQAVHCTSDGPFVIARLGYARAKAGAYVWQKLMRSGAIVTNGTDTPVEDVDPIAGFYAAVSRKLKDGTVFFPDQRMSRMEALRSYTYNNAYAAFQEVEKGSLRVGKLADITVLSQDILTIPEDEIPQAKVDYTIVGGKVMYQREPSPPTRGGARAEPRR